MRILMGYNQHEVVISWRWVRFVMMKLERGEEFHYTNETIVRDLLSSGF